MQLDCIDPIDVPQVWPIVKPLLAKATNRTAINPVAALDLLEKEVLSGDCWLWVAWDEQGIWASIVTALSGSLCEIVAFGGSRMNDILPYWSKIEDFARERGCKKVCAYGRPGWLRVLKGYRLKMAVIEKRL